MFASLIAGLLSGETLEAAKRARRAAIAYSLASLVALIGAVFLLVAAYIALARSYGAITAAVALGFAFLVLSAILLMVHKIMQGRRVRLDTKRRKSEMMAVATTAAIAALPTLMRGRGGILTILAPAAAALGYVIYRENFQARRDDREPPAT
ncbi:MAG: hypothetical protein JNL61_22205 [Rhizobiaceae bacterium]|nr:hypothetical protein [Rhizobiaceae bacterium]